MPEFKLDAIPDMPFNGDEITWTFNGYAEALAWTASWDNDSGDAPEGFDNADITFDDDDRLAMFTDVVNFLASNAKYVREAVVFWQAKGSTEEDAWERIGHDFQLTRNHHGAGFWDRGMGELGDLLTKAAHAYGDQSVACWVEDGQMRSQVL